MNISVVIPAYNSARFLPRALDSVLAQTHSVQEIIVVDDGSQDNTREVVEAYGVPVRYVHQANGGPSLARNHGIELARHPWVAFLDADDWWDSSKLALQVAALEADPKAGLCYTKLRFVDETTGENYYPEVPNASEVLRTLRYQCMMPPSTVLTRRADLVAVGGFKAELKAAEDWDLWVRLSHRFGFVFVPEPVTLYQVTVGSFSADYYKLIQTTEMILEPTLVADLTGINRYLWKRRIRAAELYRAFLSAREKGHEVAPLFLWKSVWQWPFPTFLPKRLYALLLYVSGSRKGRPKVVAAS